ncbi:MAG: gamma-glutamyltransferase [Pirellula staleyi]
MSSRRQFIRSTAATGTLLWTSPLGIGFGQEKSSGSSSNTTRSRTATGENVVATVHPIASQAALAMFRLGGNAVDAAVAAALCLGVVDGHNSGIGGGCLILIRSSSGAVYAIDGREKAPAASSPTLYLRNGKPSVELSQTGPLAAGVPSQVAALHLAHSKLGSLSWSALFEPAIHAAQDGYVIGNATSSTIKSEFADILKFEASKSVLSSASGQPLAIGETLHQTDLANTLRLLAKAGPEWFYTGEFATRCAEYLQSIGGVMTKSDFANYKAIERTPLDSKYRKHRVLGFPTPSSGGIHIAQMLNILENFDVAQMYRESPARFFHLLAESMKLAFADRAYWLGDSDFVKVPDFLTDPDYAAKLAKKVDLEKAISVAGHGNANATDESKKHTTHLTTADAKGNWVALTSTVNTSWGSKVMVPGTGVMLNNQMDDFSIAPGVPNAFGLIGSAANAVEPNKRPLSSMSPSIVLDENGKPFLTCGAAGGPKIINATLQNIVRCLDLDESIDKAIASARVHQQWRPDLLYVESGLGGLRIPNATEKFSVKEGDDSIARQLASMGHSIRPVNSIAIAQGIQATSNGLIAASDPRTDGTAIAF